VVFEGYLAFAGNEIVNSARATAYATALAITTVRCAPCSTLQRANYDVAYSSPDMDNAPWYDPAEPSSKEFAGLLGLEVAGLSNTVAGRSITALAEGGAALNPLRRPHREVQFRALAMAKTEQALSYGLSWLAASLRGSFCSSGCSGDELCFYTSCPPCGPWDGVDEDPCPDTATAYWRQMFNVGLLAMEQPSDLRRIPGGWVAQVQFTFACGDPFIYREPLLAATGPQPGQLLPNYTDPGVPPDCVESIDCLRDSTCPAPPAPLLPPLPTDVCFPTGPFTASRFMFTLTPHRTPMWQEKVPLILVKAGSRTLRRLTLRWYGNATQRNCATSTEPCNACAEVTIPFIPAGSTLTVDGRAQDATVDCPGGPGLATARPTLYGRGGTPFVWPVFSCADSMCLEVIAQADSIATDATIDVYDVVREDAV
jgi:hypothetical protein